MWALNHGGSWLLETLAPAKREWPSSSDTIRGIRFAAERRVLIRTGVEDGSSAVIVSVTDRGGSIPEEKWNKSSSLSSPREPRGMGLGLSVCRTIIAAHRGKLWATNNAGCGATFHFSLPISASDKELVITNNGLA